MKRIVALIFIMIVSFNAYATRDHFFLIGSPGAGKGTFTQFLNDHGTYVHLCLGDILRSEIARDSEIGIKIKSIVAAGKLVPNEIMFKLFEEQFVLALQGDKKIIVDGMLQSAEHIQFFDHLLDKHKLRDNFNFVYLSVPRYLAKKRLLSRLVCNSCNHVTNTEFCVDQKCPKCGHKITMRIDDQLQAIDKRLDRFYDQVLPLVKLYEKRAGFIEHDNSKEYLLRVAEYKKSYFTDGH